MARMTGLHIVIVPAWWPSPEQPMAGIFFADYARAFAAAGARIGVVYPNLVSLRHLPIGLRHRPGAKVVPLVPRVSLETLDGGIPVVRIRGLHTALGCPALQMRRFRRWLRRGLAVYCSEHGRPDVLNAMCAIPAGWACTHLDGRRATPVVVTEHTGPFSLVMTRRAGVSYVRAALARATAVVAVSEPLRQEMLAAGVRGDGRIAVIGNPVDDVFVPSPLPAAALDANGRKVYRGLFVGRLEPLKGVAELIEAAIALAREPERGPTVDWHVAGYGPMERQIAERFSAAGLADRLMLHGFCEKKEIARLLSEAHFLILPSYGENCPLAICEALSAGRPVVTTEAPGCKAWVGEGDGTVARIGDAKSLADAVRRLLADDARWDWQGIAARAGARCSGAAIAGRYAELFDAVLRTVRAS